MGPDRTCPFHVFSVFPGLTRFRPFWPFYWISLHIHGDFTAYPWDRTERARSTFSPDLHVFARFRRFKGFHCVSMGISPHIHGTERVRSTFSPFSPDLHVFARFGRFSRYHWFSMGNSPYPGHQTCYLRRGQVTCYHPSRITAQHLAIS